MQLFFRSEPHSHNTAALSATLPANSTPKQAGKGEDKGPLSHQIFSKARSKQALPYISQARMGHVTTFK